MDNTQVVSKLGDFQTVEEMLGLAQHLIDSGLIPKSLNKPAKVVAVIQQGSELGIGPMTSISNIHNIQGKPTLSVHLVASLVRKAGVRYTLKEDFVYVKQDGTTDTVKDPEYVDENGKSRYIDRRTTITFYDMIGDKIIETDFSFTWSEAQKMGLTIKDNWIKMPKIMVRNRCLALGGRFAAPDAISGMYETSEWSDVKDIPYEIIDDEGTVKIFENKV